MALRFLCGFDHFVTADTTKKWSTQGLTITAGQGRRGTASARSTSSGANTRVLDNQATWIVGMAFRCTSYIGSDLIRFLDTGTSQIEVRLTATGALQVNRGSLSATLGTTAAGVISLNTYHYLEVALTIHNTTGTAALMVDGVSRLALTSQDTQHTANAFANTLSIGTSGAAGTVDIDDVYICDGTGSAPHNTFLGDCRVDTLLPTADGSAQQWTPSTPGTHYTLVDEAAPNTTDYVSSSTVGQRDTYGMQDLMASTGTIYGVQLNLAALKSDAGARSIKPLLLSGASEALGTTTALSTSQTYTRHVQTTDPATAAAWTEVGINAAQCGAEIA